MENNFVRNKKGQFLTGIIPWNKGKECPQLSGKNHPNWKGGWKNSLPNCIDCGKGLGCFRAKRCWGCYKDFNIGENHPMKKEPRKCIDCDIKLIRGVRKEQKRCKNCLHKWQVEENSGNWKGGISIGENQKEYNRLKCLNRRSLKIGAEGSHTTTEWLALKIKYKFMCLCCKQTEPEITLTEDHIVPLSKGGTNYITNIQPLCRSCNSRKNIKVINFINQYENI